MRIRKWKGWLEFWMKLANLNKISTPRVRTVELNRIIEDLLSLYGESLFGQKQIVLSPMLDPSILPISCDEEGLKQVLLNLLINASEALSSGDQVMVCTSDHVNYEGRVMVEISVADNGPGMSPEKIAELFAAPEAGAGEGCARFRSSDLAGRREVNGRAPPLPQPAG